MSIRQKTLDAIKAAALSIAVQRIGEDGRIGSAMSEGPFLEELKRLLPADFVTVISPPRAPRDLIVNGMRFNLKLTDCHTADNAASKPSLFWSITGQEYPYSSNWNDFLQKFQEAAAAGHVKKEREPMTEYHYLVKNKKTGEVLVKSVFDIHTYVSNASNDLQINWANEFAHPDYVAPDYMAKVQELLGAIQRSVREMIQRTEKFATADFGAILSSA
jgi:hypothetical protein